MTSWLALNGLNYPYPRKHLPSWSKRCSRHWSSTVHWFTRHIHESRMNIMPDCCYRGVLGDNSRICFCFSYFYIKTYSRFSLSRSPRKSLEYFEISVPRHIRFAELRKTINRTFTFNKWICNLTPEVKKYIENIVEKTRNCSVGAISPLFHNILIPVVRFPC